MLTSSVQSTPCATADAANDMLKGLLQSAGKNQEIKVISTDVHEVDGMWIAIAFFEITQLEEDAEDDDEDPLEKAKKAEEEHFEMNDDPGVALWHGLTREQVPEASPAQDIPEAKEIDTTPADLPFVSNDDSYSDHSSEKESRRSGDELMASEIVVPENLQSEFQKAEEATPIVVTADATPSDAGYRDDLTFEERREEAERKAEEEELAELERLRAEATPLPIEAPADPAPPQE